MAMAVLKKLAGTRRLLGRLKYGADMIEELTAVCVENNVKLGTVQAIGGLQKARVGYYNRDAGVYQPIDFDKQLEITALVGNISLKDGVPMVHAHLTLADDKGNAFGGHALPGSIVFVCEFCIEVLDGAELHRETDPETGVPLWKM